MIILTLFGTTTGLELVQIPLAEIPASLKFENSWIEITERQIVTSPNNDAFVVFRKVIGSNIVTWVGLYRPALEFGGSRSGSFCGAGAWLVDCVVDVRTLTEILRDLADQIQATAMNGNRFVKRIADARNEIKVPSLATSLTNNLSKISGGCHPSGDTAVIVSAGNAAEIIDWAQRARSAYTFSKLFIAAADQVPGQSGQAAIAVHRSLPLAIESAYSRLDSISQGMRNDLNTTRNELSSTQQNLIGAKQEIFELRSDIGKLEYRVSCDTATIKQLDESLKHASKQISALTRRPADLVQSNQISRDSSITSLMTSMNFDFANSESHSANKVENLPPQKFNTSTAPLKTTGNRGNHSTLERSFQINSKGWFYWFARIFLIAFLLVFLVIGGFYINNHFFKGAYKNCNYSDFSCTSNEAVPAAIVTEVVVESVPRLMQWPPTYSCSVFPISKHSDQSTNLCSENDSKLKPQAKEQNKNEKPRSRER